MLSTCFSQGTFVCTASIYVTCTYFRASFLGLGEGFFSRYPWYGVLLAPISQFLPLVEPIPRPLETDPLYATESTTESTMDLGPAAEIVDPDRKRLIAQLDASFARPGG